MGEGTEVKTMKILGGREEQVEIQLDFLLHFLGGIGECGCVPPLILPIFPIC